MTSFSGEAFIVPKAFPIFELKIDGTVLVYNRSHNILTPDSTVFAVNKDFIEMLYKSECQTQEDIVELFVHLKNNQLMMLHEHEKVGLMQYLRKMVMDFHNSKSEHECSNSETATSSNKQNTEN